MVKLDYGTIMLIGSHPAGVSVANPGTSWVEALSGTCRTSFDFSKINPVAARLVATIKSNENISGHFVDIYDWTHSTQICFASWSGDDVVVAGAGNWTSCNTLSGESVLVVRVREGTATADMTVYKTEIQVLHV